MMEAVLQQFRQVVVFSGADQAGDVVAGQQTRARVQVVDQQPECSRVKFDNGQPGLGQFGTIHSLDMGAHAQARNGQRGAAAPFVADSRSPCPLSSFAANKKNSIKFL
jgi:hypothetical protein